MNAQLQTQAKATSQPTTSFTPVRTNLLQRKCACGGAPGPSGECAECRKKRLQHRSVERIEPDTVPSIVHDVLGSPGRPLDSTDRSLKESRFGHDFSRVRVNTDMPKDIQTKLTINRPGDEYEREADRVAEQVIRSSGLDLQRQADVEKGTELLQAKPAIQRKASGGEHSVEAPPIVHDVLRSPGRQLDPKTRSFMESRFGHDFSHVRVHADAQASESARAVGARAYTVGRDVVFGSGEYAPATRGGQQLLAHELTHVVQRDSRGFEDTQLFRIVRRERTEIGDLDEAIGTASTVAEDRGMLGLMRWGRFTSAMGGQGAIEAVTSPQSGSTANTPFPRYLYTCKCGLIDLRHFYQLMYIALLRSEETAVEEGIEHEEAAEPESAFAPEDITSNALGAEFGSQRSWIQKQSTFVSALRAFLGRCEPVQWDSSVITPAQRDCIVDYYAVDVSGGSHRKKTAGGDTDVCSICGGTSAFPFTTDTESGARII
jgi:hypothetical protein